MKTSTVILWFVLIDFLVLTGYVISEVGYLGILEAGLADWGAIQIFVDLIIACTLAIVWMVIDARERGLNPWPWVVVTLFAGSIGPLLYLLRRAHAAPRPAGYGAASRA